MDRMMGMSIRIYPSEYSCAGSVGGGGRPSSEDGASILEAECGSIYRQESDLISESQFGGRKKHIIPTSGVKGES
jgi:hypothetical protein